MRAELRSIDPNDHAGWEAFAAAERPEPWDDFGWFTLSIGPEGDRGTNYFQVLVSTPAAVSRVKGNRGWFKGLTVDSFEPEVVEKALREYVSSLKGLTWHDLVEQLRRTMHWEYEGMGPAEPGRAPDRGGS